MPPRRSSRKTKQSSTAAPAPKKNTRSKAKAKADVDVVELEDVVEETMETITTTGTAKELVEDAVKSVAEGVKDVAEGAKEFVEEMDNTKVVEEIGEDTRGGGPHFESGSGEKGSGETMRMDVVEENENENENENKDGRREEEEKQAQGGIIESQSQREDESMSMEQEPQVKAGQTQTQTQEETEPTADTDVNVNGNGNGNGMEDQVGGKPQTKMSLEERKKKLDELRNRMRDSTRQNLSALRTESTKSKASSRETARREKQLRLAETLRLKAEAAQRGEGEGDEDGDGDGERKRNWEWTVEENEQWERRKRRKERNADFEFHDEEQAARKRYKKDLAFLKPDLETYKKQKRLALGVGAEGASSSSSENALTTFDPSGGAGQVISYEQQRAAESLYRDANTLLYADNKPSEEAIDRVVEKLNLEQDKRNKFSRKRLNEDEGDITYINERNRVFNKKIARYYDKYTAEIRASFERGTAL